MGIITFWVIISISYVVIAILAPLFEHYQLPMFNKFYLFLRTSCHQIPGRCFWIWGSNMALCAKCFGLYMVQPLALLFLPLLRTWGRYNFLLPLSLSLFFPMVFDSVFLGFTNSNVTRFVLGISGGIGFALILSQIYLRWEEKIDRFWKKRRALVVFLVCLLYLASMYNISSAQEKKVCKTTCRNTNTD